MPLYAFDGTWDDASARTHVHDFYQTVLRNDPSGRHAYFSGVGAATTWAGKIAGGLWGAGERQIVDAAMARLDADPARAAIDIVGFSRGAATALDFANRVHRLGRVIRFIGLWDTVAAFGFANLGFWFSTLTVGHHLKLPADNVYQCAHAMALDERRPSFVVTRIDGAHEVWFRGCHGDIGGQSQDTGLQPITLGWMYEQAREAGLPVTVADISALHPNPNGPIGATWLSAHSTWRRTVRPTDEIDWTVSSRPGCVNPPQLISREQRIHAA